MTGVPETLTEVLPNSLHMYHSEAALCRLTHHRMVIIRIFTKVSLAQGQKHEADSEGQTYHTAVMAC